MHLTNALSALVPLNLLRWNKPHPRMAYDGKGQLPADWEQHEARAWLWPCWPDSAGSVQSCLVSRPLAYHNCFMCILIFFFFFYQTLPSHTLRPVALIPHPIMWQHLHYVHTDVVCHPLLNKLSMLVLSPLLVLSRQYFIFFLALKIN